ncbi:hypothetical protein IMSAG025_00606 [Muribaculaceae bacterium]|nr:hypothetical protein IMSAG025_00606 [Muribaculaceae bacterium]
MIHFLMQISNNIADAENFYTSMTFSQLENLILNFCKLTSFYIYNAGHVEVGNIFFHYR